MHRDSRGRSDAQRVRRADNRSSARLPSRSCGPDARAHSREPRCRASRRLPSRTDPDQHEAQSGRDAPTEGSGRAGRRRASSVRPGQPRLPPLPDAGAVRRPLRPHVRHRRGGGRRPEERRAGGGPAVRHRTLDPGFDHRRAGRIRVLDTLLDVPARVGRHRLRRRLAPAAALERRIVGRGDPRARHPQPAAADRCALPPGAPGIPSVIDSLHGRHAGVGAGSTLPGPRKRAPRTSTTLRAKGRSTPSSWRMRTRSTLCTNRGSRPTTARAPPSRWSSCTEPDIPAATSQYFAGCYGITLGNGQVSGAVERGWHHWDRDRGVRARHRDGPLLGASGEHRGVRGRPERQHLHRALADRQRRFGEDRERQLDQRL